MFALGVVWLVLLLTDVFGTVFVPRGGPGHVTGWVYRRAWAVWRRVAAVVPARYRRRVLGLGGPLLVPLTAALWIGQLVVAFTLIYLPLVGGLSLPIGSSGEVTWQTALYYSGYCATTLGIGDVYASTSALRLLAVGEAVIGFSLFSASTSYLFSVYGTLTTTTSLAREISRFIGRDRGHDAVRFLVTLHEARAVEQFTGWLSQVTSTLQRVVQGQAHYPVLHYFHIPDDESALPVTLPDLLEILTLVRTMVDPARQPALVGGPVVRAAFDSATGVLRGQARQLHLGAAGEAHHGSAGPDPRELHRRLAAGGVPVRDQPQAYADFERLRSSWAPACSEVRDHFGYR
ncbi:potassium channel family protein [Pseudosporangium ferrugineum]|uniref:Ion channel n=1 Tax=Pseudosporangium ferrugineum TaxID=439699 RepID=A0A2T0RG48_9ACTN|nr:potassium channel family protein [Pseudosporangium ferrugineum]PRY20135.1 ion channel [Pseudosporangium ferrugineum]